MSKAEKLRDRLAAIQKEREEFEKHRKELENEMHIGKQNIGKIQKGLKNNHIINDPLLAENNLSTLGGSNSNLSNNNVKKIRKDLSGNGNVPTIGASFSINSPNSHGTNPSLNLFSSPENNPNNNLNGNSVPMMANIIPSGPRISDWCFTGPLDSSPPMVKSRELYENVRLLGRGAFGEVNLVKNVEDNKLFAIKTILCPKDNELGNILREIKFLRANRHPCIIDVHDAFVTSNPRIVHIVMHYCESGTLSSVISSAKKNKNSLPEAQVLKWFIQLLLALNFLHANRTLHRDLKPMNVMLTEGGELLKIADFGLAVDIEAGDESHSEEAGTPYYTAPEMIQRENYSYPADCWSFGIILYQLLTLERPFEGSSTAELVKSILTSEPAPITAGHYSDEIKAISMGLLRKNPVERLSTNNLVVDPWLMPKVLNFPQQYRPKYLEERMRRSHVKQLESQIELIQMSSNAQKLERQTLANMSRESSFSSKTVDNPPIDPLQALDVLPTLLEGLGGSLSASEKVTINHKSFIIDDENIINTLNAQQQSMAAAAAAAGAGGGGENGNELHQNHHSASQTSLIRHAKADINIVDGVFGNEKFLSIDVKITPKANSHDNSDSQGDGLNINNTEQNNENAPVLELHYSTEIKLPNGMDSNEILGHHHHYHHTAGSRKVQFLAPNDRLGTDGNQGLKENDVGKKGQDDYDSFNIEEKEGPEPAMAIVRQRSTSLLNGKIVNSTIEEILTHVNQLNIDQLQMDQFHRLQDTVEHILHHSDELLSERRSSQKIPATVQEDEDESVHRKDSNDEGMNEKKETSNTSSNFSLPSPNNRQISGGRIGKQIAEAIENDQLFEKQLITEGEV